MDNLGGAPSAVSTQQFCLRWHNHQSSLLSSLPLLLDQSLLTDVTLSAEGRTVRAHRVVLSACSSFFSELFRTLEPPFHPVIVLPGASFGAMVALLTFMYSGEVNVFEEQIAGLLALAETLGIKGLADFNGNADKSGPLKCDTPVSKDADSPSPPPTPTPIQQAHHQQLHHNPPHHPSHQHQQHQSPPNKPTAASPLETLFAKTFPFCPSMMGNPLNFSPSAISRGAEIFARYQTQYRLNQMDKTLSESLDENGNRRGTPIDATTDAQRKAACSAIKQSATVAESMRKIDKIAENLRSATAAARLSGNIGNDSTKLAHSLGHTTPTSPLMLKPPPFPRLSQFMADNIQESGNTATGNSSNNNNNSTLNLSTSNNNSMHRPGGQPPPIDCMMVDSGSAHLPPSSHHHHQAAQMQHHQSMQQQVAQQQMSPPFQGSDPNAGHIDGLTPEKSSAPKPSNSKLYATCFICHKQLSNQYNLRVHLETHQNVRYACEVCSHVSRSKDALRKHVSYRHPGAPSPCETEAKRKRTKAAAAAKLQHDLALLPSTSYGAHQQQPMTLQQQLQSGPCFKAEPPSYPGLGLPQQPATPTTMSHPSVPKDGGKPDASNMSGGQPHFRDHTSTASNVMTSSSTTSTTPNDPSTTQTPATASQSAQHQHNRSGAEQLPQC